MPLEAGFYNIYTVPDDHRVGRYPIEDRSLLPKAIRAIPQGVSQTSVIKVEEGADEGNIIKAGGSPTANWQGKVHALLINQEGKENWIITEQQQHGPDTYTIQTNDGKLAWLYPSDDNDERGPQIQLKPLKATKTIPPQYQSAQLFKIVRAD